MIILFVENHRPFATTGIDQCLRDHAVFLATTVAEAKVAIHERFDIALVDYDLPDGKVTRVERPQG